MDSPWSARTPMRRSTGRERGTYPGRDCHRRVRIESRTPFDLASPATHKPPGGSHPRPTPGAVGSAGRELATLYGSAGFLAEDGLVRHLRFLRTAIEPRAPVVLREVSSKPRCQWTRRQGCAYGWVPWKVCSGYPGSAGTTTGCAKSAGYHQGRSQVPKRFRFGPAQTPTPRSTEGGHRTRRGRSRRRDQTESRKVHWLGRHRKGRRLSMGHLRRAHPRAKSYKRLLDNETGMHSCLASKPRVAGWHRRQRHPRAHEIPGIGANKPEA